MKSVALCIVVMFALLFENVYGTPDEKEKDGGNKRGSTDPLNKPTEDKDAKGPVNSKPTESPKPKDDPKRPRNRLVLPKGAQVLSNNVQISTNQNQADNKKNRQLLANNVAINTNQNQQ